MTACALATALRYDLEGLLCVGMAAIIAFLATSTRRSSKRCPRCREINREHARYCAQCGAELPQR